MPINQDKTYTYSPPGKPTNGTKIFSHESVRARSFELGTFFRAILVGEHGNSISIEAINDNDDYSALTAPSANLSVVVAAPIKSTNALFIGAGNGTLINITTNQSSVLENITIVAITTNTFTVTGSISLVIGIAKLDSVFNSNDLKFKIKPGNVPFEIGDTWEFSVIDPTEYYGPYINEDINAPEDTGGAPPAEESVVLLPSPCYELLRADINSRSKLIQMNIRGTDVVDAFGVHQVPAGEELGALEIPLIDGVFMYSQKINLQDGAGFPENPVSIVTGPGRALIHILQGEEKKPDATGEFIPVNKVFEWTGSSELNGTFTQYSD